MTPRRLQLGLAAFAILSAAVVFNLVYLQGVGRIPGPPAKPGLSPEAGRLQLVADLVPQPHDSDTIRAIQRELESRGYGIGRPDGVTGLVTRAAILAFEIDHGLPLSADASEDLLRAVILGSADTGGVAGERVTRIGPQADQLIRSVQQSLSALGFGPVKADGQLGEETLQAISRFEREQGLAPTGRISAQMVARLARLAVPAPPRAQR